jgi:hypothetical protein
VTELEGVGGEVPPAEGDVLLRDVDADVAPPSPRKWLAATARIPVPQPASRIRFPVRFASSSQSSVWKIPTTWAHSA